MSDNEIEDAYDVMNVARAESEIAALKAKACPSCSEDVKPEHVVVHYDCHTTKIAALRKVETLEEVLWRKIDWITLLAKAIDNRPTSWRGGKSSVKEWRNASDEIRSALITELIRHGVLPDRMKEAREFVSMRLGGEP